MTISNFNRATSPQNALGQELRVETRIRRTRRKYLGSKPSIKKKINSLKKADTLFSHEIMERDKHCMFPNCGRTDQLTCSHYIGRAIKSTRFYKDNCITLCRTHHYWDKQLGFEFQKQTKEKHGWDGRYTLFMKKLLGKERWNILIALSKIGIKQKAAIENYMSSRGKILT